MAPSEFDGADTMPTRAAQLAGRREGAQHGHRHHARSRMAAVSAAPASLRRSGGHPRDGIARLVPAARAITLPAGFTDELVTALGAPTALAFTPDGRLLITTQTGQIRVYQNGALVGSPALDLSGKLCSNSERGLLGVAVDPAFASNGYVYPLSHIDRKQRSTRSRDSLAAVALYPSLRGMAKLWPAPRYTWMSALARPANAFWMAVTSSMGTTGSVSP